MNKAKKFSNSDKPWFGKKYLGWGWGLPERREGWITIILYFVVIGFFSITTNSAGVFIPLVLLATVIFLSIVWKTSGKPQWGTWWSDIGKK